MVLHILANRLPDTVYKIPIRISGKWCVCFIDIATGLFAGGDPLPDGTPNYMWADMPSREQIAQLFYRFAQRNGLT